MRTAPLVLMIAAVTVALSACTVGTPQPTPSATEPSPTPVATAIEPDSPRADDDPPPACAQSAQTAPPVADGGAPIVTTVETADLPTAVVIEPGVEVVASADRPGLFDVVVGVCSEPLPRRVLIGVANEIAVAIAADPSTELVGDLVVVGWAPGEAGVVEETGRVSTDFPVHTWERGAAAPLSGNWE